MYKTILLIGLLAMMSGCSYLYGNKGFIQDRNTDYLKAKSIPPLKIPPGLSSSTIQADYPVPDRNYPNSTREISLIPPELGTGPNHL